MDKIHYDAKWERLMLDNTVPQVRKVWGKYRIIRIAYANLIFHTGTMPFALERTWLESKDDLDWFIKRVCGYTDADAASVRKAYDTWLATEFNPEDYYASGAVKSEEQLSKFMRKFDKLDATAKQGNNLKDMVKPIVTSL